MNCVERKLNLTDLVDALTYPFNQKIPPRFIRSDNGPEFVAQKVLDWNAAVARRRLRLSQDRHGRTVVGRALRRGPRRVSQRQRPPLATEGSDSDRTASPVFRYREVPRSPGYSPPTPEAFITMD